MRGLPHKVGQVLSFSELENGGAAFTVLTEGGPALSLAEVESILARELGSRTAFRHLAPHGISASIGQVHRATLDDGREVAVKVQLPGIAEALATDLRALGWLTAPIGGMRRGFSMAAFRGEIGSMLESELDYAREARAMQAFRSAVSAARLDVEVPEPVGPLCTPRVLTMTWIEGAGFPEIRSWPAADRVQVGRTILELFLRGVLQWRLVHADPHPGNFRFRRRGDRPVVGLVDFGCVKEVPAALAQGFAGLLGAAANQRWDSDEVWARWGAMGFDLGMIEPLRPRAHEIMRTLFEPFAAMEAFDLAAWQPGARLAEILGEHRMAFRMAAPPALVYLVRAFLGAVQYVRAIEVPVDWRSVLVPLLVGSDDLRGCAGSGDAEEVAPCHSSMLRIAIDENGVPKVRLAFGARAVDDLAQLIPEDVRPRLRERGIDLDQVVGRIRDGGYAPGLVFELEEGRKTHRVWLE
jgi:predicted unusual protein kinase regulating ubiquinone biosynthesis (AarF/ABC1/UbiB family)